MPHVQNFTLPLYWTTQNHSGHLFNKDVFIYPPVSFPQPSHSEMEQPKSISPVCILSCLFTLLGLLYHSPKWLRFYTTVNILLFFNISEIFLHNGQVNLVQFSFILVDSLKIVFVSGLDSHCPFKILQHLHKDIS